MTPVQLVFWSAGTLSLTLGAVGVFVPVMPTTPFLLLSAACYARSSPRMHDWLHDNRLFGKHLRRYRAGLGLPLHSVIFTLILLWLSLGTSAFYLVPPHLDWVRWLLLLVGLGVTAHLVRLPRASLAKDGSDGADTSIPTERRQGQPPSR
jgi:uncharacterized membrane protein YbaN (DUF454 family)